MNRLEKTYNNRAILYPDELLFKLRDIEHSLSHFSPIIRPGRLSYLLPECTCPPQNLKNPGTSVNPTCPIHSKET